MGPPSIEDGPDRSGGQATFRSTDVALRGLVDWTDLSLIYLDEIMMSHLWHGPRIWPDQNANPEEESS
jgi:hypothetical protein